MSQRITFALIAFCLFAASAARAAASAGKPSDDEAAASSKTHIEYSPLGGLFKLDIPVGERAGASGGQAPPAQRRSGFEGFIAGLLQVRIIGDGPYGLWQIAFMKVPFFRFTELRKGPSPKSQTSAFQENPFRRPGTFRLYETPLFSCYDWSMIIDGDKAEAKGITKNPLAKRTRFLDSLVFCLFAKEKWGNGYYRKEWLDPLFFTTFEREKSPERKSVKILEGPLFSVFRLMKKRNNRPIDDAVPLSRPSRPLRPPSPPVPPPPPHRLWDKNVRLMDFSWVSLFRSESNNRHESWSLGHTVFGWVMERDKRPDSERFGVLEWPFGTLWRQQDHANGSQRRHLLSLPFIGPVWSSWKDPGDAKKHRALFPRLHFWEKTHKASYALERPERTPRTTNKTARRKAVSKEPSPQSAPAARR